MGLVFVSVFDFAVTLTVSTVSSAFAFLVSAGAASASASTRVRPVDLECGLECSVLDSECGLECSVLDSSCGWVDPYASARNLPSPYAARTNASLASPLNALRRKSVDFRVSFASFFLLLCAGVGTTSGG